MSSYSFSIIIPIYNTDPKWLSTCFASIAEQNYENWECIIVDDGSTDEKVIKFIDNFIAHHPKFFLVRSAKNVGPGAARNLGMDNSKNDLILYCDSDDYLDDGALVKINDIFQKHRELEILSFNSYILTNIGIYKMALTYDGYPINQILNMDINYNIIKNKNVVWLHCYKRNFLNEKKIAFHPTIRYAEDAYYQFVCYSRASTIMIIDDAFVMHRIAFETMSKTWSIPAKMQSSLDALIFAYYAIKPDHSFLARNYPAFFDFFFKKYTKIADEAHANEKWYLDMQEQAKQFRLSITGGNN